MSDVPADDYRIATPDRFWGFWRLLLQRLFTWFFRMRVYGAEHVPRTGPAVIASNHIAGIDVVVLGAASPRTLRYMAKAELFTYNRVLTWMLRHAGAFGVRRGESDLEALRLARRVLRAGHALGVFCEGTRQPLRGDRPRAARRGTDRSRRGRTDSAGRDPGHDLHQEVAAAPRHGHVRAAAARRARRRSAEAPTVKRSSRRPPSCRRARAAAAPHAGRDRGRARRATSPASTRRRRLVSDEAPRSRSSRQRTAEAEATTERTLLGTVAIVASRTPASRRSSTA